MVALELTARWDARLSEGVHGVNNASGLLLNVTSGQCKCWKKAVGPKDVREFEDVLYRKFVQLNRHAPGPITLRGHSEAGHLGVMISKNW